MAVINPAYALQNRADHPASLFRMAMAGIVTSPLALGSTVPFGGVHPAFGAQLAVSGNAALTVTIGTGLVYIPSATAWAGMYAALNEANYTISIAAVSATQWRTDIIAAVQNDSATSTSLASVTTGVDGWDIVDVVGTFSSSSPGATPTLPPNAVPLAHVLVTPNMTVTNAGGTVVDARIYSPLSGIVSTVSSARPPLTCPEGTMWWENDTNLLGVIVSGAYNYIPYGAGITNDPWHALGTITAGWSVGGIARYRLKPDGEVEVDLNSIVPPGTPPANGTDVYTAVNGLPSGYRPVRTYSANAVASQALGVGTPAFKFLATGEIQIFGVSGTSITQLDCHAYVPLN
jgi:hypothetical protein